MINLKHIATVLSVCLIIPFAGANTIITNPGPGLVSPAIGNTTAGFDFTVGATSLLVTGLGMWDQNQNGFTNSHTVGLWDNSGNLIAQVSISSGTTDLLLGNFRYVLLPTPLTLVAGATYVMGATYVNADADRVIANINGNQAAFDPAVTPGNFRQTVGQSGLAFPNSNVQVGSAAGPNAMFAQLPDGGPGILLITLAFVVLLSVHWQTRCRITARATDS